MRAESNGEPLGLSVMLGLRGDRADRHPGIGFDPKQMEETARRLGLDKMPVQELGEIIWEAMKRTFSPPDTPGENGDAEEKTKPGPRRGTLVVSLENLVYPDAETKTKPETGQKDGPS